MKKKIIRSFTWVQKTWQRCRSSRRKSELQLGMTVTYSIAQQDHPSCFIQLAEYRCSKAGFVFYKISTWDRNWLCHTLKYWINLFSFNICPWGQKGLNSNSPPPAWVVFHMSQVWWTGTEQCWSGAPQWVSAQGKASVRTGRGQSLCPVASDKHPMCFSLMEPRSGDLFSPGTEKMYWNLMCRIS